MKRGINWKVLILSILIVYISAFIGSRFTIIDSWYDSVKPSITPPSILFPIVWNILFLLISLSIYFAWVKLKNKDMIILLFGINLFLNILWSFLFFYLKMPSLAFIDIILLWLSIVSIIIYFWKTSRVTSYLNIPYLLWVSFASILNAIIAF